MFRRKTIGSLIALLLAFSNAIFQFDSAWATNFPLSSQASLTGHQISVGGNSSCAVSASGAVECWGETLPGALYTGSSRESTTPIEISGISNAVSVKVGNNFACVLLSSGDVKCWGANLSGQLGNGTRTNSAIPVSVSGITNAISITAGYDFACALLDTLTLKCWGANGAAQLGTGSYNPSTYSSTPVAVANVTGVKSVEAGENSACALLNSGSIKCWGSNLNGRLGNSSTSNSATPVTVSGISTANSISVGLGAACALLASGQVKCWGLNSSGQLGDGTTSSASTPVFVQNITDASFVSVGKTSTCAILALARIFCWGSNANGLLGNGLQSNSTTPLEVTQVDQATSLSVTASHVCAQTIIGSSYCWGANSYGQLGTGNYDATILPVKTRVQYVFITPGPSSLDVSWLSKLTHSANTTVDYLVEYREAGENEWQTFVHSPLSAKQIVISGLGCYRTYELRISAIEVNPTPHYLEATGQTWGYCPASVALSKSSIDTQTGFLRVHLNLATPAKKVCFSLAPYGNIDTFSVLYYGVDRIYSTRYFNDGCVDEYLFPSKNIEITFKGYRNVKPGTSTLSVYYVDNFSNETSPTSSIELEENEVGSKDVRLESVNAAPNGAIRFSLKLADDYFLTSTGNTLYRNSLRSAQLLENNAPYSGTLTTSSWYDGQACCKAISLYTSDFSSNSTRLSSGNGELMTTSNGLMRFNGGVNFSRVEADLEIRPSHEGDFTFKVEVQSDKELKLSDWSIPSFSLNWPNIDRTKIGNFNLTGLIDRKLLVATTSSLEDVSGVCTAWGVYDSDGYLPGYSNTWTTGLRFTGSESDLGKAVSPIRYIEDVKINGKLLKTPCHPENPGGIAPYFVGPKFVIAAKTKVDWGSYPSLGLSYNKKQNHSVTLQEQGFGLPTSVKIRQKVGSGSYSPWKVTSVVAGEVKFQTSGKGNTTTQIQITDATGTYVLGSTSQLAPSVSSFIVWKKKTYIDGLWQGGVIRVYVSVSKWYKGKVFTSVFTSHAYDFLGIDHGDYQKSAWYRPINGSLVIDIPVSYHGSYMHNFAFVGSQNFVYTPGLGYSFQ